MRSESEQQRNILPRLILVAAITFGAACSSHPDRLIEIHDQKVAIGLNGKLNEMLKMLQQDCNGYGITGHSSIITYDQPGSSIARVDYTLTYETGQQSFIQNFKVEPPLSEDKKADMSPEQIARNLEKQIRSFFQNKKFCDPDTKLAHNHTVPPLTLTRLRDLNTSNEQSRNRRYIPRIRANI